MREAFFPWKDSYSVNVQEIDVQHKEITNMLNDLYDAFLQKEHETKIGEIIGKLTEYALYHFETEEKYFHQFSFPKMEEHVQEHRNFTEKVKLFRQEYDRNKGALTYKLINFLREWLMNHILISDKEYANCFAENGLV
jgi:hemerythrin